MGSVFWTLTSDSARPFFFRKMGNVLDSASPAVPAMVLPLRSAGDLMFWLANDCTEAGVVWRKTPRLFTLTPWSTPASTAGVSAQPKSVWPAPVACTVFCEPCPARMSRSMPCFSKIFCFLP